MTKRFSLGLIVVVALAMLALPAMAVTNQIAPGGDVFMGEQGLNITLALNGATQIAWFSSTANPASANPDSVMTVTDPASFYVGPSDFQGKTGNWYQWFGAPPAGAVAFNAKDPALDIKIWDTTVTPEKDVTSKSVTKGNIVNFRIESNLYSITLRPGYDATKNGFVTIKVKTADGGVYSALVGPNGDIKLVDQNVNNNPWYWPVAQISKTDGWMTGARDANNNDQYKSGVYTVYAETNVNKIKDNYKDPSGNDYTGKTVTALKTVTLASDTVKLEASKDSIVRGNPFSVTISGAPNTAYKLWVKGTSQMSGIPDDQPPRIVNPQDNVFQDPEAGPYVLGDYEFQAGGGKLVYGYNDQDVYIGDVPQWVVNDDGEKTHGVQYYAEVKTSTSGTRTVEWTTTKDTKDKKYTFHVERKTLDNQYKTDDVDVKIEKGAVTVIASGDMSYYLGEEIKLSGTNSETDKTYLFITGPNLPTNGGELYPDPRIPVDKLAPETFVTADVLDDNTWSYKWVTASLNIDAGTYTIYAVSNAATKADLSNVQYGTVSVVIKKPFVAAVPSQTTIAQGDKLYIKGTAQGKPTEGVAIWILGKNKDIYATESVNDDSTFSYEVKDSVTKDMYAGQYFVVVQHPMYNDRFDVYPQPGANGEVYVVGEYPVRGDKKFMLEGRGSLQGSDAAEALINAINDPSVDDTYTKLQFMVETPKITIKPVGEQSVGSKFTVSGTTNLAVDDQILVEVVSSSFKPTQKTQSGEFSGASGTVKVVKGSEGLNTFSLPVDAATFKPDEYIVQASGVTVQATDTALFNVVEFKATPVPTTAAPTQAPSNVTTVPTTVATTVPTTVPTTAKSPGFGVVVALIGLGAVAFIAVRRN